MARPTSTGETWSRWLRGWTAASSVGVCVALLMWSTAAVVWTAAVAAICAAIVFTLAEPEPRAGRPADSRSPRTAVEISVLAGSGTVAAAVLGTASGLLLVSVLLVALATSPPVLRQVRRSGLPHPPVDVEHEVVAPYPTLVSDPRSLAALTDQQLCFAWRYSFFALQDASSIEEKSHVVAVRMAYLDELETRSAAAVHAWLESGARASEGPERFLRTSEGNDNPHAA